MTLIYIAVFAVILATGLAQEVYAVEKLVVNQTISYQIVKWTNDQNVTNADLKIILHEAIFEWESINPGLKFEETDSNPNIEINWENTPQYVGLTICDEECVRNNIIDYSVYISIGTENCLGEFTYMTHNFIKRVIMHELGHTLGIGHTKDDSNLMYGKTMYRSTTNTPVVSKNMGFDAYNIPNAPTDWLEGREKWNDVAKQIQHLNERVFKYDKKFAVLESTEARFQTAFEKNIEATKTVLIEMTTPIKSKIPALNDRMNVLQSNLNDLNERYAMHIELYDMWKTKFILVDAEMTALKEKSNMIESLICFPAISTDVIKNIKMIIKLR